MIKTHTDLNYILPKTTKKKLHIQPHFHPDARNKVMTQTACVFWGVTYEGKKKVKHPFPS